MRPARSRRAAPRPSRYRSRTPAELVPIAHEAEPVPIAYEAEPVPIAHEAG